MYIVKIAFIIAFTLASLGALISTVEGFKESWYIKNYRKAKAIDVVVWAFLALITFFYLS